jgi:hypothetical protein
VDWSHLAESRIQEWLRTPEAERRSSELAAPAPPLELDLLDRIEAAVREESRAVDEAAAADARRRGRDAETQLFALLDATGRSILAPLMAERVAAIRQGR